MTDQPEMMRTARGARLVTRPARDGVVLVVTGIEIVMTIAESQRLRRNLDNAEILSEQGNYFDE